MAELVGVHFRNAGKIYYLAAGDLIIHMNDKVICMTQRGMEYGVVRTSSLDKGFTIPEEEDSEQVVIRIATQEDIEKIRGSDKSVLEMAFLVKRSYSAVLSQRMKKGFARKAPSRDDFRWAIHFPEAQVAVREEFKKLGVPEEEWMWNDEDLEKEKAIAE